MAESQSDEVVPQVRGDGDTFHIDLAPGTPIASSSFPHPLVTIDYDEAGTIIGIELVGSLAAITRAWAPLT